jgi:hypothetical protein
MDPNVTLRAIRLTVAEIHEMREKENWDSTDIEHLVEMGNELADMVDALDEWLLKGGALPLLWKRG